MHIKFKKSFASCFIKPFFRVILLFTVVCAGVFGSLILSGCDKEKPAILFSATPFSKEYGYTPQNTFKKGEKIYYLLYNPDEFKTRLIKVQVFRKESEKSEFWGYEYLYNKTVELQDKKLHTDYFIINKTGYYIFQIFEYTNTLKPVIEGIVQVVE